MEKLIIADNDIYIDYIDKNYVDTIANEAEEQLNRFKFISKDYDAINNSGIYMFRSPTNLDNPITGPGYQWRNESSDANINAKNQMINIVNSFFNQSFIILDSWFLLQTQESWIDNPFHQHLTSKYQSVVYVKCNENDFVEFKSPNDDSYIDQLKIEEGMFVIFASDVWHRPGKNTGAKNRISFNNELY